MRYLSIFIVCLLLVSCNAKKVSINDVGKAHLHGKVRLLTEADYVVDTTGQNQGKRLRWTFVTLFNEQGYIANKVQLDDKGDTARMFVYVYDKTGRKMEEQILGIGFGIINTYKHDTLHNTAVSQHIGTDGTNGNTFYTYKFNKANQVLEWNKYQNITDSNAKGKIKGVLIRALSYTYDADGKLMRCDNKTADSFKQTCIYTYDKQGNCISEIADTAQPHQTIKTLRQFDDKGNETSEIAYEADGSIHSKKTEEYKTFDEKGNWLVQYAHWKDLGVIMTERKIEYYGE